MLAAPTLLKPRFRDVAPDLWSVRALVLEPTAVNSPADVLEMLREAEGLLLRDQATGAVSLAWQAVEILRRRDLDADGDRLLPEALVVLAKAEDAMGYVAAAIHHIREAIDLRADKPVDRSTSQWFELWLDFARKAKDPGQIILVVESALKYERRSRAGNLDRSLAKESEHRDDSADRSLENQWLEGYDVNSPADPLPETLHRDGPADPLPETLHRDGPADPFLKEHRYGSADRFYRVRLVRRYRVAVGTAIVLLVAGLIAVVGWYRAAAERDQAERRAESMSGLIVDISGLWDSYPFGGWEIKVRELLDAGKTVLADPDQEPEARAALLQTMGRIYRQFDNDAEGRVLLEEALRLRRETLDADHPLIAESLLDLAHLLHDQGELAAAGELFEEAVAILRHNAAEFPLDLARGLTHLSRLRYDKNRYEEAEGDLREALEIHLEQQGGQHPEVAVTRRHLGTVLEARGELEEAAAEYQEALDVQLASFGEGHPEIAVTRTRLVAVLAKQGDFAGCEPLARQALSTLRSQRPESWRVAEAESVLGGCLAGQGRRAEAEPLLRESHDRLRQLQGEDALATREAAQRLAAIR